jgi:hypothetical protein
MIDARKEVPLYDSACGPPECILITQLCEGKATRDLNHCHAAAFVMAPVPLSTYATVKDKGQQNVQSGAQELLKRLIESQFRYTATTATGKVTGISRW